MNSQLIRARSPLFAHRDYKKNKNTKSDSIIVITEIPFCLHLNLRINQSEELALSKAELVLGQKIPIRPNTSLTNQNTRMSWLGPDEWLLISSDPSPSVETQLINAWAPFFHSIVNISGGQTVIQVSGTEASELLNRGCPIDLHPLSFREGDCAQSLFYGIPIFIVRCNSNEIGVVNFELVVRRSFADSFIYLLIDSAKSYQVELNIGLEKKIAIR